MKAVQVALKAGPTGDLRPLDKGGDGILDETVDRSAMNIKLGEARMAANAEAARSVRKNKKKARQAAWPLHPDIHET